MSINKLLFAGFGFAVLAVALLVTFEQRPGKRTPGLRPARLPLSIDDEELSLGKLNPGDTIQVSVPIRNPSARPVTIKSFLVSCKCLEVRPSTMAIAADSAETLYLKIQVPVPREFRSLNPDAAPRGFGIRVAAISERGNAAWTLSGWVEPPLAMASPKALLFGHVGPDSRPEKTVRLSTIGEIESLWTTSHKGFAEIVSTTIDGSTAELLVRPRAEPGQGSVDDVVDITGRFLTGEEFAIPFSLHYVTPGPVTASPSVVIAEPGGSETVVLSAINGQPFTLLRLEKNGLEVTETFDSETEKHFQISGFLKNAGKAGGVRFTVRCPEMENEIEINVPVVAE